MLLVNQNFRNENLEEALSTAEKTLQKHYQLTPILSSPFARVNKFSVSFGGSEKQVYLKQYLYRSTWDFIKHLVRSSRAKRAFKASMMLERNGFKAPVIVIIGERKSTFLDRGNFLVTLEVEDAKQIHQFLPESSGNSTTEQLRGKRELIRAFGRTVGKMHAAGIVHGDLKLVNVLARQEKGGWRFFFIDNERTKKFRRLPAWLRLKNLVQLNMFRDSISRTDRLRFFKAYLEENQSITPYRNIWAQRIFSKTDERFSEMLARGRIRR